MRPVTVYLDSSDFSLLSDPRRDSPQTKTVLNDLLRLKEARRAVFFFSGIHLSEMAPTNTDFAEAATRRADLLVQLCDRNALISQDRLLMAELEQAVGAPNAAVVPHSEVGEWYPTGALDFNPLTPLEMGKNVEEAIVETTTNRETRRAARRKALRAGKPRLKLQTSIVEGFRRGPLDDLLKSLPMKPEDARTISNFLVGYASRDQAVRAFEESLRDPRWMMQWFEHNHTSLYPFIKWTREAGLPLVGDLENLIRVAAQMRYAAANSGQSVTEDMFSAKKWASLQDGILLNVANRLITNWFDKPTTVVDVKSLDTSCPGLSVAVRSLHAASWASASQTPRQPKLSDFPDAMHATYAPYVDIFRADSFMAPHIAKFANRFQTRVVARLVELPNAIQDLVVSAREA
jgi:hypothetical protein